MSDTSRLPLGANAIRTGSIGSRVREYAERQQQQEGRLDVSLHAGNGAAGSATVKRKRRRVRALEAGRDSASILGRHIPPAYIQEACGRLRNCVLELFDGCAQLAA
jgi:hypothetical protein